jgi:hypothetical protein
MPDKAFKPGDPSMVDTKSVWLIMIMEAPPSGPDDRIYTDNTIGAFRSAGLDVTTINDILSLGVYLTVAVPEACQGQAVPADTIKALSNKLEQELDLFPAHAFSC